MIERELRFEMVEWGRLLFERGYVVGSAGNLSVRVERGFLVTPTNSCLGRLVASELSVLDGDWKHLEGQAPTKEVAIHRAMYAGDPQTEAVVHLHSTYATALSCLKDTDASNALPPITPYAVMRLGRVPVVPYFSPGSDTSEEHVRSLAQECNALLLANHGSIVGGPSLASAVFAAEELEETAKLVLLTRDRPVRVLDANAVNELVDRFRGARP